MAPMRSARLLYATALAAPLLGASTASAQPASTQAPPARAQDPPADESPSAPAPTAPKPSQPPHPPSDPPSPIDVTVQGDAPDGDAASRVRYSRPELELRPRLRPGDVVEAVPGVFAVQHAGGGKANQYFLRGFDADHGTDLRIMVDGVPVNMVSHGHGQGFADLHFLIPELVVGLDGYKGPYYAPQGDFATAGAIDLHLAETLPESYAQIGGGQYGVFRALVIESPELGDAWRAVAAAEVYHDDGPFKNPERLWRFNLYAKITHDFSANVKAWLSFMSYGSSWHGSGQIPARAVCGEGEAGQPSPESLGGHCIDHFGTIDPSEGGSTQRHAAQLGMSGRWDDWQLDAMAYMIRYRFQLYSNFTFFADDPVHGDEIEQDDSRLLGGLDAKVKRGARIGSSTFSTTLGLQTRVDGIENALYHDQARERLDDEIHAQITESSVSAYLEEDARLTSWLRIVLGLRADRFDVTVDDLLEDEATLGSRSSGDQGATLFSPKASAVISPFRQLDVFLDYGRGFHSNDARGAVLSKNPVTLLTPATGYEGGVRVRPLSRLVFEAAVFLLDLDSELVWSGDTGGTEASGATRRYGVELTGRYQLASWLFADVESAITKARFRSNAGNGDAVALAPTFTFTAGFGMRPRLGDFTPFASLRLKAIGDRPANQARTLTADGFAIVDANTGLRWKDIEAGLDVQNLFNAKWREVNFASTTRLPWEPKPVTGIHYSPGWPFTAIGRLTVYWR